jgi:uncharacterized membrane protein (UPF0127 family)
MSYKYCKVKLARSNKILFENVRIPNSFYCNAKGLLGENKSSKNLYMLFRGCNSIHMFGMRVALDVIFLSSENVILKCVENLKPWQLSYCFRSSQTLELPIGTIQKYRLVNNMKLEIQECTKP